MPSSDVMLMLMFFKERNKPKDEIDLSEVDASQFAKAIGAG